MPMHAARARKLIKRGEATPYWDNGIYCIRLIRIHKRLLSVLTPVAKKKVSPSNLCRGHQGTNDRTCEEMEYFF